MAFLTSDDIEMRLCADEHCFTIDLIDYVTGIGNGA